MGITASAGGTKGMGCRYNYLCAGWLNSGDATDRTAK